MQALDAPTLLLVNALFNAFAGAGWALLAGVFRMAPRASWLMVAAHACRVLALILGDLPDMWPPALADALLELLSLGAVSLLALALRRMVRLDSRRRDVAVISALSALGIVASELAGMRIGGLIALSAGTCLLGLGAARDVVSGVGPGLARWVTALMAFPYLVLALAAVARIVRLLSQHELDPLLEIGRHAGAVGSSLGLVLTMGISVALMALLVQRVVGRIEHLTRRDAMTNTLNRRAISDQMQTLQALRERGHGFALILIDIDHFKRINDDHGHAAGDAALLHFVAVMGACLRELDQLGRLGGEEFCALLPHTSVAAAAQVAERMRVALQSRPVVWRERSIDITASFGVVAGQGNDPQGETALALADRQVYRAKGEGRNRVCVAAEALA